jgi:hypothetical protein
MSIPVVERTRFMVGKYEIVAQPIPGAAHMLRYTVFVGKQRIGAMVSRPTESDCRFLEKPPVVPPLKIFQVTHRPGRPKKGSTPPVRIDNNNMGMGMPREEIPAGITVGERRTEEA